MLLGGQRAPRRPAAPRQPPLAPPRQARSRRATARPPSTIPQARARWPRSAAVPRSRRSAMLRPLRSTSRREKTLVSANGTGASSSSAATASITGSAAISSNNGATAVSIESLASASSAAGIEDQRTLRVDQGLRGRRRLGDQVHRFVVGDRRDRGDQFRELPFEIESLLRKRFQGTVVRGRHGGRHDGCGVGCRARR